MHFLGIILAVAVAYILFSGDPDLIDVLTETLKQDLVEEREK